MLGSPIHELGGKGLFVKEIEDALLQGRIDAAVHSLKDLPSELPEGLILAVIPEREEPWDALVSRGGESIRGLAPGSRIGTGSLRRIAQLRRFRRDLKIVEVARKRGYAPRKGGGGRGGGRHPGLWRVSSGWGSKNGRRRRSRPNSCCPPQGQGALAIETREPMMRLRAASWKGWITRRRNGP